jgi:hypothetical protein
VVHDEPSQARGRFELWQLRHGSHDFALAARGPGVAASRTPTKAYAKAVHSPGLIPIYVFRTDGSGVCSYLYAPECVEGEFSEVRCCYLPGCRLRDVMAASSGQIGAPPNPISFPSGS